MIEAILRRRKVDRRLIGALALLGLMLAVAVGVAVNHALTRISDQVLTVILTIGCAAGLGLPATLLALVVLVRRAENGDGHRQRQAQVMTTPPQVVVIPPMQIPPQQAQLPPYQGSSPATWEQVPARHFTVVGEE
jgi:hypothetical protein